MMHALMTLNYVAVLVVAAIGFLLGWLWYSPALFAKPWMAEMKLTEEKMKECMKGGMAKYCVQGFVYTLVSTFGLAVLIQAHGSENWLKGAEFGAFVGLVVIGGQMLNCGVWEQRSGKLQAINLGHIVVLFAVQGAILGVWR